jgi:hypothetical protein
MKVIGILEHLAHVFGPLRAVWHAASVADARVVADRVKHRRKRSAAQYVLVENRSRGVHIFADTDLAGTREPTSGRLVTPQVALIAAAVALELPGLTRKPTPSIGWRGSNCALCIDPPKSVSDVLPRCAPDTAERVRARFEEMATAETGVPICSYDWRPVLSGADARRLLHTAYDRVMAERASRTRRGV